MCMYISCTKEKALQPGSPAIKLDASTDTLFGKWNVVYDSSYTGVGINNHLAVYTGVSGDYFDFRADSYLYIKEGASFDTLLYTPLTDSTVIIASFGITLNGVDDTTRITGLSSSTAILTASEVITPGGIFFRKVKLKR